MLKQCCVFNKKAIETGLIGGKEIIRDIEKGIRRLREVNCDFSDLLIVLGARIYTELSVLYCNHITNEGLCELLGCKTRADYRIDPYEVRIMSYNDYNSHLAMTNDIPKDISSVYIAKNNSIPVVKRIIFSGPATIVFWEDGTKTVVKLSEEDIFDEQSALAYAFMKKVVGENKFHGYIRKSMRKVVPNAKD